MWDIKYLDNKNFFLHFRRDAASTTQGSKFKMQQVADFSEHESQVSEHG